MLKFKTIKNGLFTLSALSGAILAMETQAACVQDAALYKATLVVNQTNFATMKGANNQPSADLNGKRFIYLNNFISDPVGNNAWKYPVSTSNCPLTTVPATLCDTTPTNPSGLYTGGMSLALPVVCTVAANPPPATGATQYQKYNIATTWNNVGNNKVIGLAGALKMRSDFQNPTLSLRWEKLYLKNTVLGTPGTWELWDEHGKLFDLYGVTKTLLTLPNRVRIQASLKFGTATGLSNNWSTFFQGLAPYNTGMYASNILKMTAAEAQLQVGTIDVTAAY